MKINSDLVKRLRAERLWSQEKLSEACGLDLRTIQRIESSGNASLESAKALAAVLNIEPHELIEIEKVAQMSPLEAVITGFSKFADFTGTATRFEYWWFFLFVLIISGIAAAVASTLVEIVSLIIAVPLIAAGTRRLNETGHSGWWQLLAFVPFGIFIVLFMLAQEGGGEKSGEWRVESGKW